MTLMYRPTNIPVANLRYFSVFRQLFAIFASGPTPAQQLMPEMNGGHRPESVRTNITGGLM